MTDRAKTILLVGSILLNAMLIGFVLGQLRGEAFARAAARHAKEAATTLPTAVDTVLAAAFETERLTIADAVRVTRLAQADAADVVRRDPVDLDKLDAALARARAGEGEATAAVQRALRSAAAKLDPKNRDYVAEIIEHAPPGGPGLDAGYRWTYYRTLLP